jgi:formylglycine-generating enzyme required for sulfatase activity
MPIRPTAIPGACAAGCSWASPMQRIYPESGRAVQLLRGGSWNNNPRNCRSAYRNHNQPDNTRPTTPTPTPDSVWSAPPTPFAV